MDTFQEILQARDTVTSTIPAVCFDFCSKLNTGANSVLIDTPLIQR